MVTAETEFQTYFVVDPYFQNVPALSLAIPAGWSTTSVLKWALGDIRDASDYDFPINVWARAEDPASGSAFEHFPTISFSSYPGMGMMMAPSFPPLPSLPSLSDLMSSFFGRKPAAPPAPPPPPPPPPPPRIIGATLLAPMGGIDALVKILLPRYRGHLPDLKVIGSSVPPELAEQAKTQAAAVEAMALRLEYTVAGRAFEEEIQAIKLQWYVSGSGPAAGIVQTNWQLYAPFGMRAPKGMLDGIRPLMLRALALTKVNPEWIKLRDQAILQLQQQAQAYLQQGYDSIAAAGAISRQISANNDAVLRSMDANRQQATAEWNQNRAAQAAANAHSPTDGFSDYIRGVNTYEDPYWGQSQHSSEYQYAWTDGSGSYKFSNDASFDPNIGANQNWQLMKRVGQ